MSDIKSYYLPYVTYGREKYEYHTKIVGLYENERDAEIDLVKSLIKMGVIFSWISEFDYDDRKNQDYWKAFKDEHSYYECVNFKENNSDCFTIDWFEDEYKENIPRIIDEFHDSYYTDGWDYDISELKLQ